MKCECGEMMMRCFIREYVFYKCVTCGKESDEGHYEKARYQEQTHTDQED
jgi:hypothetical protein